MPDRPLGTIIRLQIQREPLKEKGVGYDPSEILEVAEASLDSRGMTGHLDGEWLVDAHNADHPRARGGGKRALSIGFEGHYEAMVERWRPSRHASCAKLGCCKLFESAVNRLFSKARGCAGSNDSLRPCPE